MQGSLLFPKRITYTPLRTFTDGREAEEIFLPKSNVIKYFLADGSWVCVRPSGTEPKIKYYFGVLSGTEVESKEKLKSLKEDFSLKMNQVLSRLIEKTGKVKLLFLFFSVKSMMLYSTVNSNISDNMEYR